MTRLRRLEAPERFELWSVDLLAGPSDDELAVLSPDEHERAGRFAFARDRRRYIAARAALRRLLAQRLNAEPGTLSFDAGPHGKPALRGGSNFAFNLSHSEDVAWIAFADGRDEIGVDVEVVREIKDAHDLARRNYTATENEQLALTSEAERSFAFLRCWTRKEACLKAIGSGFSIAPETFEAGVDNEVRIVQIATTHALATVRLFSLAPENAQNVVGALARLMNSEKT